MRDNPFTTRFGVILLSVVIISGVAGGGYAASLKWGTESKSSVPTEQASPTETEQSPNSDESGALNQQAQSDLTEQSDSTQQQPVAEAPSLPSFSQFTQQASDAEAPLQLDSTSPNWDFRTRIRVAYRGKSDFGANGVVAIWGCGTSCSMGVVVDRTNGSVIDIPLGGEANPYLQVHTKRGSSLLLATWEDQNTNSCVFEAYVLVTGKFEPTAGYPKKAVGTCPSDQ